MNKRYFSAFFAVFCPCVMAATTTPAHIPSNLHVYGETSTYVDLVAHDCSGRRYYIKNSHLKYDAIVTILLAAQMAKKEVQLRISGCNSQNQGEVVGVYLK